MIISEEKGNEILAFLENEAALGKRWVVFDGGSVIKNTTDLNCFKREFDASQYAHDYTTSYEMMVKEALKTALKAIYEKLLNNKHMNTQNLEFLQSNLKYFGFGEKLNDALESHIQEQKPAFQLNVEIPQWNKKMSYALHFKKSDSSDMYFFNRYDATLQNGKPEEDKKQSFYVNKGNGITAKESFNLLEGRSVFKDLVNKEGERYSAWLKLDFENPDDKGNFKMKQFTAQYGYNLEKTLANFPIKDLADPEQKDKLISSLEKGNAQQVTISKEGKDAKFYIEAVPQFKNINIYDQKMHMVKREDLQQSNEQTVTANQKPVKKQDQKSDAEEEHPKQKQPRKRKMSI
ncbi:hypothetical protein WG906_03150 [Pedobacter sp. P351]|uniref:hypothetical protein n=1 Tax=Pedobacter superstes TaxID=3133441 RepID=UPI0030A1D167